MVGLEKNGPILFVKPFPKPEALEIDSCLDMQESYVLKKICPDYSVICINREGKHNKQHVDQFREDIMPFYHVVLMGKQCCKMLGIKQEEWVSEKYIRDKEHVVYFWTTPALGTMMTSNKRLKQFRAFVEKISADV